jgi:hypothetical protein
MDYVYVRAWGRNMGSHASYIADQVAEARKDRAPDNATHKLANGTWATMDDLADNAHGRRTRENVEGIAAKMRAADEDDAA